VLAPDNCVVELLLVVAFPLELVTIFSEFEDAEVARIVAFVALLLFVVLNPILEELAVSDE
jgi:hypothetical protein